MRLAVDTCLAMLAPPAQLRVRDAAVSDAEELAALHNAYANEAGGEAWLSVMNFGEWIKLHQTVRRPLWMACIGERTVGWLSFLGFCDRPGCEATAELGIRVHHDMRGQGIGRQLVSRAIASAPGLGFDRLIADIHAENDASLALFRGQGFEEWGRKRGVMKIKGRRLDCLVLGLELDRELDPPTAPR